MTQVKDQDGVIRTKPTKNELKQPNHKAYVRYSFTGVIMSEQSTKFYEKQRQDIKRLYLQKGHSQAEIARSLNLDETTISRAMTDHILPELAAKFNGSLMLDSHRLRLEKMSMQEERILAQIANGDPSEIHRWERLLQDNAKLEDEFYRSLRDASPDDDKGGTVVSALRFDEFVKLVGYPQKPRTGERLPLTPAQLKIYDAIGTDGRKANWVCLTKSRQIGASRVVQYAAAYNSFKRYRGKKIIIVAGTNADTGQVLLDEVSTIYKPIRQYVKSEKKGELTLNNGTQWLLGTTSPDYFRGISNAGLFICEESCFWSDKDQSPEQSKFLNAIMPIVKTNGADIISLSSANGISNWHYGLMHSESKRWQKLIITILEGAVDLYSPEEVKEIMAEGTPGQNEQEFMCVESPGAESWFGEMDPQDFVNIAEGLEERNPEDD